MAEWAHQHIVGRWGDLTPEAHDGANSQHVRRQVVPGGLLTRACHALPWAMLVVSAQGRVSYYNQAYAQLRGLPPGAFLGHPVAALDRRHRLRELLRTGRLPPERGVPGERRINQEIILPLWEEAQLLGIVVVVLSAVERSAPAGSELC